MVSAISVNRPRCAGAHRGSLKRRSARACISTRAQNDCDRCRGLLSGQERYERLREEPSSRGGCRDCRAEAGMDCQRYFIDKQCAIATLQKSTPPLPLLELL